MTDHKKLLQQALLEIEAYWWKVDSEWGPTEGEGGLEGAILRGEEPVIFALREAIAQPVCAKCDGTKVVSDGQLTHSESGVRYENGPVVCIKDCPDCTAIAQPAEPMAWAIFAGNGNMRLWSRKESYVKALGDELGLPLVPLYAHPLAQPKDKP